MQNDLVHGWGLDFQLGYCAQVLHFLRFSNVCFVFLLKACYVYTSGRETEAKTSV